MQFVFIPHYLFDFFSQYFPDPSPGNLTLHNATFYGEVETRRSRQRRIRQKNISGSTGGASSRAGGQQKDGGVKRRRRIRQISDSSSDENVEKVTAQRFVDRATQI